MFRTAQRFRWRVATIGDDVGNRRTERSYKEAAKHHGAGAHGKAGHNLTKEDRMRKAVVFLLAVILFASPAMAQTVAQSNESKRSAGTMKVWIGIGALALGTLVTAKSSDTSTATSSLSTSQLATGLVIAGAGGFLIWKGVQERNAASPSTTFGISAGKQSRGVFVRQSW
jgi:hypothetical protein